MFPGTAQTRGGGSRRNVSALKGEGSRPNVSALRGVREGSRPNVSALRGGVREGSKERGEREMHE